VRPISLVLFVALTSCDVSDPLLGELEAELLGQPPEVTTIVSFGFDDGYDSQLVGADILEGPAGTAAQDSYRGTFFIVSGALRRPSDGPGRLTQADVKALAAAGHEIAGHTLTHQHLPDLALDDPHELRRQVCNDRRALEALGHHPAGFAYPFGENEGAESTVAECGYAYGRDAGGLTLPPGAGARAETVPPLDPFVIRSLPSVDAAGPAGSVARRAADADELRNWVEQVRNSGGGWLNITLHHIRTGCGTLRYCMETSELEAFVAWLRTRPSGVAVRTLGQVMIGDPLVANPSLERTEPNSSPVRPACFWRAGNSSNFPSIQSPGPGRTGAYAEILRPTAAVATPMIQIFENGRDCSLPVVAGRRYEVRAHARALQPPSAPAGATGQCTARLVVSVLQNGTWRVLANSPTAPVAGTWTLLRYISPKVPANATAIAFGVRYAGSSGSAPDLHVDDFAAFER
jgi:peptidoglycan/xylan/chitin deacetylase (PgdA/CDA1 family)